MPQVPPHPSSPHSTPIQLGVQEHRPSWHASVSEQVPQTSPQTVPQLHPKLLHVSVQSLSDAHCPSALQTSSTKQAPQVPPHPSSPQVLPAHSGVQAAAPSSAGVSWPHLGLHRGRVVDLRPLKPRRCSRRLHILGPALRRSLASVEVLPLSHALGVRLSEIIMRRKASHYVSPQCSVVGRAYPGWRGPTSEPACLSIEARRRLSPALVS